MQRSRQPGKNGDSYTEGDERASVSSSGRSSLGWDTQRSSNSNENIVRLTGTVVMRHKRDLPWGIRFIQKVSDTCFYPISVKRRDLCYRISILVITYLSYTAYHLSRKPISIVKNVLNQNCSSLPTTPPPSSGNSTNWCDWAPFDGKDAETLLGTLDSSFLFAYAAGMFVSGFVAERVNLRYFLSLGMLFSGFFTYLFGLAYTRNVHNLSYFIMVQFLAGIFQTTGWPGVVTVVGNWFGKGKRGLIFGLWNSHTSLGNILGSVIAGGYVEKDWGMSFIIPAAVIGATGFLVFLFLVPKPQHVGCTLPDHEGKSSNHEPTSRKAKKKPSKHHNSRYYNEDTNDNISESEESDTAIITDERHYDVHENTPMIAPYDVEVKVKAVGFYEALKIPGVIEFSLSLFFAKLVSYTFLYWLPRYISTSSKATFSPTESANLSTLFDVGGIIGGIIAGVISDYSGMSATTCAGMLTIAIPMLLVYEDYGSSSLWGNIVLLVIVGILVNGPYALITTAVSTELGTHPCLQGNARALATVTAIIDGTGSIGAAVGPLLAGPVSDFGWKYVFYMLMLADVFALLFLIRLVVHEIKRLMQRRAAARLRVTIHSDQMS